MGEVVRTDILKYIPEAALFVPELIHSQSVTTVLAAKVVSTHLT